MFSWAASRLESIAQTVAPPPDDPNSKFVYCCQRGDEQAAIQIVQQNFSDPVHTIVQPIKGQTSFHMALLHAMPQLVDYIMQSQQQPTYLMVTDGEGNTALHYACMSKQSNALDLVKKLVAIKTEQNIVTAKNNFGQTPYDVATLNSIRQYLLPIQLQAETQAALDNGGVGLPPGIDLGGLRIKNSNLPPPPQMGGGGPPTMMSNQSNYPATPGLPQGNYPPTPGLPQNNYPPTPGLPQNNYPQTPGLPQNNYPQTPGLPQQQATPQYQQNEQQGSPGVSQQPAQQQQEQQQFAPPSPYTTPSPQESSQNTMPTKPIENTTQPQTEAKPRSGIPPAAPQSSGSQYALRGQSSAAILTKSKYQPDGFHSSSSDKNLQEKYGHVNANRGSVVPPPPSSGNSINSGNLTSAAAAGLLTHSAPPSFSSGPNPFARGHANTNRRYVAYDPITGKQQLPTPPTSAGATLSNGGGTRGGMMLPTPPAPGKGFAMFTPRPSSNGPAPAAAPAPSNNTFAAPNTTQSSNNFAAAPAASSNNAFAAPPAAVQTSSVTSPSGEQSVPANTPTTLSQPTASTGPVAGSPSFMPSPPFQQRTSTTPDRNAANVFGSGTPSPSKANSSTSGSPFKMPPSPSIMQRSNTNESNASNASDLFSRPMGSPTKNTQNSNTGVPTKLATDVFGASETNLPSPIKNEPSPIKSSEPSKQDAATMFGSPRLDQSADAGNNNDTTAATTSASPSLGQRQSGLDGSLDKVNTSAVATFASPPSQVKPTNTTSQDTSTTNISATQLFAAPPAPAAAAASADPVPPPPENISNAPRETTAEFSDDDEMQDVPLTPGTESKAVPAVAQTNNGNSLVSAIGMPPPPFSKK